MLLADELVLKLALVFAKPNGPNTLVTSARTKSVSWLFQILSQIERADSTETGSVLNRAV